VEAAGRLWRALAGPPHPLGRGTLGNRRGKRPTCAGNSALGEPSYVALDPGVRSSLSLPLSYHDELLGVLSLEPAVSTLSLPKICHTLKALADQLVNCLATMPVPTSMPWRRPITDD